MKNEPTVLSAGAFANAAVFLKSSARLLERARFEQVFASGPAGDVGTELMKFQNPDGGFGHGLEPDLRTPESSALCTSVAFQIVRCHRIPKGEPFVRRAIRYLADTFDPANLHWRIIPEGAEGYPHAPWWNQEGRKADFEAFSLNPTADILGILLDAGGADIGQGVVPRLMDRVMEELESYEEIENF